jgi:hypothetical protein
VENFAEEAPLKLLTRLSLTLMLTLALGVGSACLVSPAHAEEAADAAEAAGDEGEGVDSSGATATVEAEEEEAEEEKQPTFGGTVIYENAVGLGTFVTGAGHRPSWGWSLSLRPRWSPDEHHTVSLRFDIFQDFIENADTLSTEKQRLWVSDTWLFYSYKKIYTIPVVDIDINPGISFAFPTSPQSRFHNLILGVRPTVSLTASPLEWLNVTYYTRLTKNFNRFTSPVADEDDRVAIARSGGSEAIGGGEVAMGGRSNEYSWLNRGIVAFTLPLDLTFTVDYIFYKFWTYSADLKSDEYSSSHASAGRGTSDVQVGALDLTWETPIKGVELAAGVMTEQTPKTADNDGFRFPFFDFTSPANNLTTFYFDVAYTY